MSVKLQIIGSSATQTATLETSAFTLYAEKEGLLVDCGPGTPRQLQVAQIDPMTISTILITHLHGDHVAGLPYLLFLISQSAIGLSQLDHKVRLASTPEGCAAIQDLLNLQYPSGFRGVELEFAELALGSECPVGNFLVTAIEGIHSVPSISVILQYGNIRVAYSSDTVYSPEFVEAAAGVDVMLHEAFGSEADRFVAERAKHSLAQDAGRAAETAGAGQLVLMHALPKYFPSGQALVAEARQHYLGKVTLPQDLDIVLT